MSGPVIALTQEVGIQTIASVEPLIVLDLAPEVDIHLSIAADSPIVLITLEAETVVLP